MPEAADAPTPGVDNALGDAVPVDLADRLLAVRAAEGDEEAFAVLVRRHSRPLLALAQNLLGNPADAEDAVQDAFVNAWRWLPQFHHHAAFRTWMYRIVTNCCLSVIRRRPPVTALEPGKEPAAEDARSAPARVAEANAAATALAASLARLGAEQRACWVLRELHGLHYDEIAQVMGTSEQTVRGRLFRARRSLTEAMSAWR